MYIYIHLNGHHTDHIAPARACTSGVIKFKQFIDKMLKYLLKATWTTLILKHKLGSFFSIC